MLCIVLWWSLCWRWLTRRGREGEEALLVFDPSGVGEIEGEGEKVFVAVEEDLFFVFNPKQISVF